jgi:ComF family protein
LITADFLSEISDTILPPLCIACSEVLPSAQEKVFCRECRRHITYITQSHCPVCGMIFPDSPAGNHLCGSCLEKKPHYTFARSALIYDGIILNAVHQFKYGRNLACGKALADLLADFDFPDLDWDIFDVMIPVPLHIRRLRTRGFNQSLILARALEKKHNIHVDFSLLKRRKLTLTQTGLDKKERQKNIQRAFEVTDPERIEAKNIILVDDVLTTGATANECAKILKKAGARQVGVITLARVL